MLDINFSTRLKLLKIIPSIIKAKYLHFPFWCTFVITRKCNLKCQYCYSSNEITKELTTTEVFKVISKLQSLGVLSINYFGGEPTLRRDFCEILKYSNKKGILSGFATNGLLLDKNYIEKISRTGVDFIILSLDSISGSSISKKSYTNNANAINLLLEYREKYGFFLSVGITLTQKNIDTIFKTIDVLHNYKIPMTISLINENTYNNLPVDETLYFNDKESKEKLITVINKIEDRKKQGAPILDPTEYLEDIKARMRGKLNWNCDAGKYFFSVESDGSVQLCQGLKSYPENVLSINQQFFYDKQKEIKKTLAWCTKKCYSSCSIITSSMINHPIKTLFGK